MSKGGAAAHLFGAILGATVLLAAAPAAAQQAGTGERATNGTSANRDRTNAAATRKPVKPVAGKSSNAADKSKSREPGRDPWSIDDALLSPHSKPLTPEPAEPAKPQFGRIQLDTGSIGLETEAKLKENRFSDGRVVPGLETVKRQEPSYFGLSLSVPTNSNSFLPAPINPWERKE